MRRRAALLIPALAASWPAVAADGDYAFRVKRRGDVVGTHTVRFETRGAQRIATSELLIRPSVMGIVVYRYDHTYEEVTEAGRFRRRKGLAAGRAQLRHREPLPDAEAHFAQPRIDGDG